MGCNANQLPALLTCARLETVSKTLETKSCRNGSESLSEWKVKFPPVLPTIYEMFLQSNLVLRAHLEIRHTTRYFKEYLTKALTGAVKGRKFISFVAFCLKYIKSCKLLNYPCLHYVNGEEQWQYY